MPELRTYKGEHTVAEWWEIAEQEQKNRDKVNLFKEFIQPHDLVFDIGAYRGVMTMVFRWLDARVIAVEPLVSVAPHCIPEFKWKFIHDPNVRIVAKAIAPTPRVAFWLHKHAPYLSSMNRTWMTRSAHRVFYNEKNARKKFVQAVTLDSLIAAFGMPRFIKIDVEGSENLVLKTLTQPVAGLSLEFHEDWIPKASMRTLMQFADYEWNYALNETGRYVLPEWATKQELLTYMGENLTKKGPESWGDVYARIRE